MPEGGPGLGTRIGWATRDEEAVAIVAATRTAPLADRRPAASGTIGIDQSLRAGGRPRLGTGPTF